MRRIWSFVLALTDWIKFHSFFCLVSGPFIVHGTYTEYVRGNVHSNWCGKCERNLNWFGPVITFCVYFIWLCGPNAVMERIYWFFLFNCSHHYEFSIHCWFAFFFLNSYSNDETKRAFSILVICWGKNHVFSLFRKISPKWTMIKWNYEAFGWCSSYE